MYSRVAVSSTALSTKGIPLPTANLIHRLLLEQINAHGRLVFACESEIVELIRAIKSSEGLPQDARGLWLETLIRLRSYRRISVINGGQIPLADVQGLSALRAGWGSCTDVAVVAEEVCSLFGIPVDLGILSDTGLKPDVTTAAAATDCPELRRVRTLSEHPIAGHGSRREEFWRNVLEPLASEAQTATLLDGYLFKLILEIATKGRGPNGIRREHISWMLNNLDDVMASGAEIRLIGKRGNDSRNADATEIANAIRRIWNPAPVGRLSSVTVVLSDPIRPERFPHDRHIRFSSGSAIELSAGFDRLREETLWDPDGMKWTYQWRAGALTALQQSEDRAIMYARHSAAVVLQR